MENIRWEISFDVISNNKKETTWQTVYEQLQEIERIDKVLEDMENIKFHCDMRYCNWEECKQQLKQSILIHIPTK